MGTRGSRKVSPEGSGTGAQGIWEDASPGRLACGRTWTHGGLRSFEGGGWQLPLLCGHAALSRGTNSVVHAPGRRAESRGKPHLRPCLHVDPSKAVREDSGKDSHLHDPNGSRSGLPVQTAGCFLAGWEPSHTLPCPRLDPGRGSCVLSAGSVAAVTAAPDHLRSGLTEGPRSRCTGPAGTWESF